MYIDVDGTLTGASGEKFVDSALYASLVQENVNIADATFKSRDEIMQILSTNLTGANAQFAVVPGAIRFLETMLQNGAEIHLVTKNRKEYVEPLLAHHGLSSAALSQIHIHDALEVKAHSSKLALVQSIEKAAQQQGNVAAVTGVLDDSSSDFQGMCTAIDQTCTVTNREDDDPNHGDNVEQFSYSGCVSTGAGGETVLVRWNSSTGQFNFDDIGAKVLQATTYEPPKPSLSPSASSESRSPTAK